MVMIALCPASAGFMYPREFGCLSPKRARCWLDAFGSLQAPQGFSPPLPFQLYHLSQGILKEAMKTHQGVGKGKPRMCPQDWVQATQKAVLRPSLQREPISTVIRHQLT